MYTLASELFHTHWSRARCHLDALFVVRRGLLLTSPCVDCCALVTCRGLFATSSFVKSRLLVSSFANVIGVVPLLQASEFYHVRLMKASPKLPFIVVSHLLYLVLIVLLLSLLRRISPVYSTEYIPKYSSIENIMKLPFQQVVIRFKRSSNEGVMPVSLLALCAVQKFSECTIFNVLAISACRNLRLTWFLIRWNWNFVKLLNIQKYAAICFFGT